VRTWFAANNLVLNIDKINTIKFITSNYPHWSLNTGYKEKYTAQIKNIKMFWFTK